ncbi:MAG: LCP family glycopolymer transferase, partial [Lachnospiraceae bacterium]
MSKKNSSANRNSSSRNRQRNIANGSRGNGTAAAHKKKDNKTIRSLRTQGRIRLATVVLCWLFSFLAILELFIFNVLPTTYFLSACVIITMINILLTAFWRNTPAFVLGIIYALLMAYIVYLVGKANNVLDYITTERDSYINVNVYVDKDDPAKELADASDYTFGYLEGLDEANMARALTEIQDKLGHELAMTPYTTTDSLFAGLANKEIGAVLLNESYVTIYDDNLMDEINKTSDSPVKREEVDSLIENSTRIIYSCSMLSKEEESSRAAQESADAVTTEEIIPVTNITSTPFIVYVSGSDTRRQDLSVEERSDVNIMVVINPVKHQVLLVSTPRDFAVPLADHDGWLDKLTNAGIYGVNSSVKTLENLYGVDISYYAKINFAGFREIVNALGGVDVWSDYDFKSSLANSDVYYKKGWNHLGGQSALYFVRERYAFKSGDWQRSRNQMHMIKALEKKLESPAVLTGYNDLMNAIADCFLTNMPRSCIEDLV